MTSTQENTVKAATLLDQVQHVSAAVSVRDLDESVSWYVEKFGFAVQSSQDFPAISARVAYLRHRDVVLELIQATPAVGIERPAPPYNYAVRGYAQISLYVEDIYQARALAQAQGLPIVSDIVTAPELGVSVFLTKDLDGNYIEIAHSDWPTA
jgi:catechol 2,3-dioxygenase-like lactoylglutathione lyase family enzyme